MISGDAVLGDDQRREPAAHRVGVSPGQDSAHIESGAQRLNHALATRWKSAVEAHPDGAAHLRSLLRDAAPSVAALEFGDRFDHPTADADLDHLTAGAGRPVPRWAAE